MLRHFRSGYHWSFMQVEYVTDVVFHRQAEFQPLYEAIVRTAVHIIKAEHVVTFLGRKLTGAYQGELGNDFSTRIQGTRIRHHRQDRPASSSTTSSILSCVSKQPSTRFLSSSSTARCIIAMGLHPCVGLP